MKTGGRQKGTPNKKTQALMEKCELLGVDPFHIQLLFAKGDWKELGLPEHQVRFITEGGAEVLEPSISPELRQKAAKDVCEYLYPKRKALEHSMDIPQEVADKYEELKDTTEEELKKIIANDH